MRRQPQTARPDTVLFFAHGTGGKQNPWRHLSRDVKETRTNKNRHIRHSRNGCVHN